MDVLAIIRQLPIHERCGELLRSLAIDQTESSLQAAIGNHSRVHNVLIRLKNPLRCDGVSGMIPAYGRI
jgi:hypothetical protein